MSIDGEDERRPGPSALPRWVGAGLLVSLGVNLFLGGLVAAFFLLGSGDRYGPRHGEPMPALLMKSLKNESRDLPDEARDQIRRVMGEEMAAARPRIRELQEARRKVVETVAAEPFDPQAVDQAFDEANQAMLNLAETSQAALLAAIQDMTPQQRQTIASSFARFRGFIGGPQRGSGSPNDGPHAGGPPPGPPPGEDGGPDVPGP